MRIHKEGTATILIVLITLAILNVIIWLYLPSWVFFALLVLSIAFFVFILSFFRNPIRTIPTSDDQLVYAPADGKVVVIEETQEPEYFRDKRLQLSIFMSPLNVHVNRNPVSGVVKYYKYHPGKYLVAWHPKSSEENERNTVVVESNGTQVLVRQIAGAVARRIVNYLKEGEQVAQGNEMGFIKFGSRVDVFLPLDADIKVEIGQTVRGNQTVLAHLK